MATSYLYRIRPGSTAQAILDVNVGPEPVDLFDHLLTLAQGMGLRAIGTRPTLTVTAWTPHDELAWTLASAGLAGSILTWTPAA